MSQLKICPKCQATAPLDAAACSNCAHEFRTQFTARLGRTQMHAPPMPPSLPPTHFQHHMATLHQRPALTAAIVTTSILIFLVLMGWATARQQETSAEPSSPPTDVVLSGLALPRLWVGESENEMLIGFGKPAPSPAITDSGGHLWVYDMKEGGILAARFEWNGEGYALRDALTINSPVKFNIGPD